MVNGCNDTELTVRRNLGVLPWKQELGLSRSVANDNRFTQFIQDAFVPSTIQKERPVCGGHREELLM